MGTETRHREVPVHKPLAVRADHPQGDGALSGEQTPTHLERVALHDGRVGYEADRGMGVDVEEVGGAEMLVRGMCRLPGTMPSCARVLRADVDDDGVGSRRRESLWRGESSYPLGGRIDEALE